MNTHNIKRDAYTIRINRIKKRMKRQEITRKIMVIISGIVCSVGFFFTLGIVGGIEQGASMKNVLILIPVVIAMLIAAKFLNRYFESEYDDF